MTPITSISTLGLAFVALSTSVTAADLGGVEVIEQVIRAAIPLQGWPTIGRADATTTTPAAASTSIGTTTSTSTGWALKPTAGASWNIQLAGVPPAQAADDNAYGIWDFDMADASIETIQAFHARNRSVICYFSAGSWEKYRSDAGSFPDAALGKVMEGWPDEKWVDIRNEGVRDVMRKRIQQAKDKGCDGVDPDNIDGYGNDSGFPLTASDSVDFVRFLAKTAHDAGLSYGLKNGGDIVDQVIDVSEWCVQEECVFYRECAKYEPFIKANKPIFHIEYPDDRPKEKEAEFIQDSCNDQDSRSFSTLVKKRNLDDWTRTCP